MKRITVFKETTDNWFPSYKVEGRAYLQLVTVELTQTGPDPNAGNGEWRVCVWGGDDCGMERDFDDLSQATDMFYQVIGWESVDVSELTQHGFVSA